MRRRVSITSGMTSNCLPGNGPTDLRNAVCNTERPSLMLILSPENIRSLHSGTSASLASDTSKASVSAVIRCLEKS